MVEIYYEQMSYEELTESESYLVFFKFLTYYIINLAC